MHVLRTFLRPGWLVLGVVVIAFAAACFMLLAPWQLGKNSNTEHRNDLIKQAVATDAVPLDEVARAGAPFDKDTEWRAVTVTGNYLPGKQVLVRLRSAEERPAIEVLTPFAVAGSDRVVLVNRGYVRPEQTRAVTDVPAAPSGRTTITGRIRASEGTSPGRGAHQEAGAPAVYTIDPAEVGAAAALTFDPFYLQLSAGMPGSLGTIALPQLDSGPYLSYGLQWLAFGIMAPLGLGYFIWSELKHRRRAAAPVSGDSGDSGDDPERVASKRARARADMRRAASGAEVPADAHTGESTGIGHGPDTQHSAAAVREKLSRRYGG
ncbi:hypothetical protein GII33_13865 [Gordonia pseudamarae]|uniref:SURF1-like protein n=1 Tax=Gordonia pseudamarae TaxID=2831662 RepID=A0ABX6IK92_9ACTN|nr:MULTISPECIES: SURF1 family cytochrome oxidase biogenesis protein [Gordonia]MBD0022554.1 hypothetical protein [Gordonia sp. (in: high G+C Gram-positive bacteria)]QHN26875.1 hypothetical protein GII33_13865 [Gordonia pseudamarae]QHN35766.1 hypothetical protein GII31_13690 [Gordonia pseudamarae]